MYDLKKGDYVLITDRFDLAASHTAVEIVAKFEGRETLEDYGMDTPRFITEDGETLYGFSTYWLPLEAANKARVKYGLEEIEVND